MKKLLIISMLLPCVSYALGGGHASHSSHASVHSSSHSEPSHSEPSRPSSTTRLSSVHDDNISHTNISWQNNWSIFNRFPSSHTVPKSTVIDDEDDCKKYKQYSTSNNLKNCDYDGNVQQYKEFSTH